MVFLNTELGTDEEQQRIEELLRLDNNLPELDEAGKRIKIFTNMFVRKMILTLSFFVYILHHVIIASAIAKWLPDEKYGGIKIRHFKVHIC